VSRIRLDACGADLVIVPTAVRLGHVKAQRKVLSALQQASCNNMKGGGVGVGVYLYKF
jgi:hypothetical protein